MIKVTYITELQKDQMIKRKKNVLSFNGKTKDDLLPIYHIGWGFIWHLLKNKIRNNLYLLITPSEKEIHVDFFKIKK